MISTNILPYRTALILTVVLHYLTLTALCKSAATSPPSAVRILSPDNPFRENLAKNVSWSDPLLQESLWAGKKQETTRPKKRGPTILEYRLIDRNHKDLAKRATTFNPLISLNNCLFCQGKARTTNQMSVAQNFMADQMVEKMISFATIGECLFYGQRPPGLKPTSLSKPTTNYACLIGAWTYRTIWQLWPGEGCEADANYYCLDAREPGCCWLNPLMPSSDEEQRIAQTMVYFQQMSKAMALTCRSHVSIMLDDPSTVEHGYQNKWDSIWVTHELPVLRALYRRGLVTKLTVIIYGSGTLPKAEKDVTEVLYKITKKPWDRRGIDSDELITIPPRGIDWDEPIVRAVMNKRLELIQSGFHNMSEEHKSKYERRGSVCAAATNQENPRSDYFG